MLQKNKQHKDDRTIINYKQNIAIIIRDLF